MPIHSDITPQSDGVLLAKGLGRVARQAAYQQTHSSGSAFYDDGSGSGSGIVVGPGASSQGGIARQDAQGNLSPVVDTKPIQDAVDQANKDIAANKTALADAQKTISQAESDADSAKKSADTAQQTANSLADDVSKATQTASSAQTAANDAQSTADNANDKADAAQSVADDAHKTASNAMTTAANAQEQISEASGKADSALQEAENADSNASTAAQNAADALKNANSALARAKNITRGVDAPTNPSKGDVWYPVDSNKHVTGMKIWNGSAWDDVTIIAGKILVPGTVGATEIADSAITAPKIQAGAVQADQIAADAVSADKIGAGAVTADKLAADSVNAANIVANAITAEQIASDAVTSDKIAANAVTADKIAANSIDASKIKGQKLIGAQIETSESDPHMLLTQEEYSGTFIPAPIKQQNGSSVIEQGSDDSSGSSTQDITGTTESGTHGTLKMVDGGSDEAEIGYYHLSNGNKVLRMAIGGDSSNTFPQVLLTNNGSAAGYIDAYANSLGVAIPSQMGNGDTAATSITADSGGVGVYAQDFGTLNLSNSYGTLTRFNGPVLGSGGNAHGYYIETTYSTHFTVYDRGSDSLSGSNHIYATATDYSGETIPFVGFQFLDVYYATHNGTQGYTRVWDPQNGTKFVTQIIQEGGDGNMWAMSNTYTILNDSEMNVVSNGSGGYCGGQFPLSSSRGDMNANPIFITHVEGWLD